MPTVFKPTDFSTDFMDDPSATEDLHNRKYHSMPTTWLFGLVGAENWAPEWMKRGYNQSIEGLAYQWLHDKPYFKESPYQNPGMLNDILSTVMSFATVTDFATLGAGSLAGKAAMGSMMARGANLAQKAGVGTRAAKKAAQEGAEQLFVLNNKMGLGKQIGLSSIGSATTLGFYEGLHSATAQLAEKDDIDFLETLKGAARGAATGAVIGGAGATFAKAPIMKKVPGLKRLPESGALSRATVGEVTGVGVLPSLESVAAGEPRLPTAEDFIYAGGLVAGLKIQKYVGKKTMQGVNRASGRYDYLKAADQYTPEEVAAEKRKVAKEEIESGKKLDHAKEEWADKTGEEQVRPTNPNWRESSAGVETFEGMSKNDLLQRAHELQRSTGIDDAQAKKIKKKIFGKESLSEATETDIKNYMNHIKNNYIEFEYMKSSDPTKKGTKGSMRIPDFFGKFSRQSKDKWLSEDVSENRKSEIKEMSDSLGETEKDFKSNLKNLGYESVEKKYGLGPGKKKIKEYLDEASPEELVKIKDHYKDRMIIEDFVNDMSQDKSMRMHMLDMDSGGVLKKNLSGNAYGFIRRGLTPLKKLTGLSRWAEFGVNKIKNADFQDIKWSAKMATAMKAAGIDKLTPEQAENFTFLLSTKGGRNFVRVFEGSGENRRQAQRTIVDPNTGKEKKVYSVRDKEGKLLDLDVGEASPRNVTKLLDYMYFKLKKAGIPVKDYIENYMPQLFKLEKLSEMLDGVSKLHEDSAELLGNEMLADSPGSGGVINNYIRNIVKSANEKTGEGAETAKGQALPPSLIKFIRAYANKGKASGEKLNYLYAWNVAKKSIFSEKTITAPHAEKIRKIEIPDELKGEFLEMDARKLLLRYTSQFSKRLAFSQEFGLKGERMHGLLDKLSNRPQEQEALNRAYHAFTGMIEHNPNFNYTKTWKNLYQNTTNFMVATKIGMGFATIPNITQSIISTAAKHGYGPMLKGWYRMWYDKPFQKRLLNNIGQNQTDMMKLMFGLDINDVGLMAKFANKTTTWSQFNRINKFNYMLSASTMHEVLLSHQKRAKGEGVGRHSLVRDRSVRELKKLGFDNINENLDFKSASPKTRTKIMKAMYEFARDAQLQRNVLNDPYWAASPKVRPWFLFKRFGFRQASWITETVSEEMFRYKNPLPLLRLTAGGALGGMFVSSAKEMISDVLAGEDVFDDKYSIPKIWEDIKKGDVEEMVDKVTLKDIAEAWGAVGALGFVTDIISAEDRLNAVEFLVTPALAMDGKRVWDTFSKVVTDSKEFGIDGAVRRAVKVGAPLLGTLPARAAKRIQPRRQKVDYYTRRKSFVKQEILDAIINENPTMAIRLIKEWNSNLATSDVWQYQPTLVISYEDIGPDAIVDRYIRTMLKRADIPQSMAKYIR